MGDVKTMTAVVLSGPFKIAIEQRSIPTIVTPTDAIIKVSLAGICGSELHAYRGHQKTKMGHVMVLCHVILHRFEKISEKLTQNARATSLQVSLQRQAMKLGNSNQANVFCVRSLLRGK
jgi:D-arabinose 1-dehydrogenase-like Zn-dependent alcohol dehydrogenase